MCEPKIFHEGEHDSNVVLEGLPKEFSINTVFPKKRSAESVFSIMPSGESFTINTSYFIGHGWIIQNKHSIFIQPKLNKHAPQTDYIGMLFTALAHPDLATATKELFIINWDEPFIKIKQEYDLLTPLLVVQFLRHVQSIVRKGLKKSYYRIQSDLTGKIKGKILIAKTIKQNTFKNKILKNTCSYDEFGINGFENRLLKKTLEFTSQYLAGIGHAFVNKNIQALYSFIMPAFQLVSTDVNINEIKSGKTNVFYKDYDEAIRLAKIILRRFGYNMANTLPRHSIETPPYWIDMSKLFEIFVLQKLRYSYGNNILFQPAGNYGNPDFIQIANKDVIDAKYKSVYKNTYTGLHQKGRNTMITDIRQISAYARDIGILKKLGIEENEANSYNPACWIIYPDQSIQNQKLTLDRKESNRIQEFAGFFKVGINLPIVKHKENKSSQ
jgi:5-methylcytosine-specific restriction enzyme subunit McrC